MNKSEMENLIVELDKEIKGLQAENIYLKNECEDLVKSLTVLGKTCHSVYRFYPYIFSECCENSDLIKLFKVQDAFKNFFNKLKGYNNERDEENEI